MTPFVLTCDHVVCFCLVVLKIRLTVSFALLQHLSHNSGSRPIRTCFMSGVLECCCLLPEFSLSASCGQLKRSFAVCVSDVHWRKAGTGGSNMSCRWGDTK